tara:strand:+ start:408 stop:551 length:144 start_codon:yes stop_codon:yes gene_type:complete
LAELQELQVLVEEEVEQQFLEELQVLYSLEVPLQALEVVEEEALQLL